MRTLLECAAYLLLSLLAATSTVARKLVLRQLTVPPLVDIRDDVTLSCRFDLSGERLYSVKWYKDEFEFYRFIPANSPPCQSLLVPGVTLLNEKRCNMQNVTLTRLTFNSSGTYRCEVSTEAPNFQTVFENSNMSVRALPLEEPMIEGVLSSYSPGDSVRALCTSAKSRPPAQLAWFVNGVKVEPWSAGTLQADERGLFTATLGLSLVAERRLFPAGRLELRCAATVGERSWSRAASTALSGHTQPQLAQQRRGNSALPLTSSCGIVLAALLFALKSVAVSCLTTHVSHITDTGSKYSNREQFVETSLKLCAKRNLEHQVV